MHGPRHDKIDDIAAAVADDLRPRRTFEFHRRQISAWTWEQELASYEAFARRHAENCCRSLLARFRGDAPAGTTSP